MKKRVKRYEMERLVGRPYACNKCGNTVGITGRMKGRKILCTKCNEGYFIQIEEGEIIHNPFKPI